MTLAAGETKKIDLVPQKSGMELWPGGWTENSGWFTRRGGGVVLYGQPRFSGTVEFTARLRHNRNPLVPSPRLRWVVNFLDDHNYLLFQIDGKYFYRAEVIDGASVALPKIAHHIPERSAFVNLEIVVQAGLVEHRWSVSGDNWKVLDDLGGAPAAPGRQKGRRPQQGRRPEEGPAIKAPGPFGLCHGVRSPQAR